MPRKKQKGFWSYVGSALYYMGLDVFYTGKGIFKLILTITIIGIFITAIWLLIDLISMPSRVLEKNRAIAKNIFES